MRKFAAPRVFAPSAWRVDQPPPPLTVTVWPHCSYRPTSVVSTTNLVKHSPLLFGDPVSVAGRPRPGVSCKRCQAKPPPKRLLGQFPILSKLSTLGVCILIDAFSNLFQGQVSVNSPDPGPRLRSGTHATPRLLHLDFRKFGLTMVPSELGRSRRTLSAGPNLSQPRGVWLPIACFR